MSTKKKKNDSHIGKIIAVILTALAVVLLTHPTWLPISPKTAEKIQELEQNYFLIDKSAHVTVAHILTILLVIAILWLFSTIMRAILLSPAATKNARSRTVSSLVLQTIKYLVVIIGAIWILRILGVDATAVLAGVGIIGLILGFGAQSLIEDVITGLFIIFEGKYSIGDIIVLDDFRGIVRDIGVRTTTIEDAGYNLKVVNNSDIRNFQNRSRNTSLAVCLCSVAYETDLRALEKMLNESLPDMYLARKDLYLGAPRYLGVHELADSGVVLKFVADVKEENIFAAQRALNRDIRVLFADKGVEIPFPQVVVHQGD
jgi:small conductance mechanosensitive channel